MEERIIELESRLAHQDHVINELNDVIYDQQKQIDRLSARLDVMLQRIETMADGGAPGNPVDEVPPHY